MDQVTDIVKLNNFIFHRKKLRNLDKKAKFRILRTGA